MAVWCREDPIGNLSLKDLFYLESAKIDMGKNDISCVISCFRDY